ncbi:MAG: chitobiase/beta-hexosaminidase C-terminal domain-containing protein [Candidatus Omnitrophota bacterium]
MRPIAFKIGVILLLFLFIGKLWAAEALANSKDKEEAIIVLSSVTMDEMQSARKTLEKNGITIQLIFSPSVFIAVVPHNLSEAIKQLDFIEELSYDKLVLDNFKDYETSTLDAIKFWNSHIDEQSPARSAQKLGLKGQKQAQEAFRDTLLIPTDLPKTKEESVRKNEAYKKHWLEKKIQIDRAEKIKQQDWQKKHTKKNKKQVSLASLVLLTPQEKSAVVSSANAFGKAYGAGVTDTSLYMAGDIVVDVVFVKGNLGDWPDAEKTDVYNAIVSSLQQFSQDEPNAHITFDPVKEDNIPQVGDPPKPLDLTPFDKTLNKKEDLNGCREYLNDLRNKRGSHWAYLIIVEYGNDRGYSYLNGPLMRLYVSNLRNGYVVRHETMHTFGAQDQYPGVAQSPIDRWGYLKVVNANSQYNNGKGYFSGAGEGQADIMLSDGGPIGVYSRGQIGWRDSDGDGVLEPLDTFPDTSGLTRSGNNPFTYTGKAIDKVLLNAGDGGDVTLNTISKVEYRLNGGAWCQAAALDGVFDSAEEDFRFTLPALKNGDYIVEVRAANSVNNTEVSFAKDEFIVSASQITNVRPFAAFSITPPEGSINTNFVFDASESSDLEDPASLLQVRWDYENDGIWDTTFSTTKKTSFKYSNAGVKTVALEVKDRQNNSDIITRQINVAADNIAPHISLLTTPENYHGNSASEFKVSLDARGSYDGEDAEPELKLRWDFEGDGVWDAEYSNNLLIEYLYQLPLALQRNKSSYALPSKAYDVYVAGSYAYVADGPSGLQIIDISNFRAPALAGSYNTPGDARGVYVTGNYAYVADGPSGLQIIDISNPQTPVLAGSYGTLSSVQGVYVLGNYAYVADFLSGLKIIDISNPQAPVLAGSYDTPGWAEGVYVLGNYAYVADHDSGLQIIDISNPHAPVLAGNYDTPGSAYRIYVLGNYAYVADGFSGLKIIDISNPRVPVLAGSYDSPLGFTRGIYIAGKYAYVAGGFSGLQIIDISNPHAPVLAGNYDTPDWAYGIYVLGNYAYVADYDSGLQIIGLIPDDLVVDAKSCLWKIKAEMVDKTGNVSSTSRNIWAVTYNHPPRIENLQSLKYDKFSGTLLSVYNTLGLASGICIVGNYAYVAEGISGLQSIDISNPQAPVLAESYNTPGRVSGICIAGNYAYLAEGVLGLQIIDVSNPRAFVLAGSYGTLGLASGVYVLGKYAYVADGDNGLQILDISNPKAPILAGSYDTLGLASGVYVAGNYAYVADGDNGLQIIDISNLRAPVLVGSYDTPGNAHGVYVTGNYAYVADGNNGLQVLDISNPHVPTLVGSYDTPGLASGVYVSSNYAGSYYAYVADGASGLEIILLDYPKTSKAIATATDPDIASSWDGLLEYRWDLDNDGVWDTRFSKNNFISIPTNNNASKFACQVRDRFGAADTKVSSWPDAIAPATAIKYSPAYAPGSWIKQPVKITLNASDAGGSGIKEVLYSLDGSTPAIKYSNPFVLDKDGIYNLQYLAVDNAGNSEKALSVQVKIDLTAPAIIPSAVVTSVTAGTPAIINTTITDAGSGVKVALAFWYVRQLLGKKVVWVKKGLVPLKPIGNKGIYSWAVPGLMPKNTIIKYFIIAQDNVGNNALSKECYIVVK